MIKRHYHSYIRSLKSTLDEIDFIVVERIIKTLLDARERDKQVFIIGNGGSATTASHLACDLFDRLTQHVIACVSGTEGLHLYERGKPLHFPLRYE